MTNHPHIAPRAPAPPAAAPAVPHTPPPAAPSTAPPAAQAAAPHTAPPAAPHTAPLTLAALALTLTLAACADPAPPPAAPLAVRYAGCAELAGDPITCALAAAAPLRLWIPGPDTPTFTLDGAPLAARVEARPDGHRAALDPPPHRARHPHRHGRRRPLHAPLAPPPPPIDLTHPDAEARVTTALATAAPADRARLLRAAGRLALRRGELDRAADRFTAAEAAATAAAIWSEARLAATTRAHVRYLQGRIADARAALDALPAPHPADAYGAYATRYAAAVVARAAGDLRAAARDLDAAAATAEQVGLTYEASAARNEQAGVLIDLGRIDEAIDILAPLLAALPQDDPCTRSSVATNLGWALIRAGRPAIDTLGRALALVEDCGRETDHRRAIARVNLAIAHLEAGDPEAAAAELSALDPAADPSADAAAWRLIVEGRLARHRADPAAARAAFEALTTRADAAGAPALRWRAHLELGLTAESTCDWPLAIEHYRSAEALLFDESLHVAADAGRTRFLADRGESAALLVRALVTTGDAAAAFDAARRARRRVLLGFSQQARLEGLDPARRAAWEAAYARYTAERAALDAEVAADWDRSAEDLAARAPDRAARQTRLTALLDEMATLAGRSLRADAPLRSLTAPTVGWFPTPVTPSPCAAAAALPSATVTAAVPSAAVPSAAVPSAAVSSAAVSSAAVPSAAVPSAAVPSAAVPSAAVPSAVPSAAVPSAVHPPPSHPPPPHPPPPHPPHPPRPIRPRPIRRRPIRRRPIRPVPASHPPPSHPPPSHPPRRRRRLIRRPQTRAAGPRPTAAPAAPAPAAPDPPTWVFFAHDGRVTAALLTDLRDPYAPITPALDAALRAGASRVELMPAGALRDRDLHLAPIGELPLALRVPVAWRLDGPLAAAPPAATAAAPDRHALVVVDPRIDLAAARREGDAVVERLRATGWTVDRLQGTAATRAALRQGFTRARLFHYAGHAIADGLDGWQSAFLLAEGPMTVGDLLTLRAVPRYAILAGCETGRAPGEVSGIGLAHALLATGAEAVIATVRPVADTDAALFSAAFYDNFAADPAAAYRQAIAAIPASARGAFRLLVP
ncbi:MAG: CHAT domain-containing protein [bacterium]